MNEGEMDVRRLLRTMGISDSGSVCRWRSQLPSPRLQSHPPSLPSRSSASVVPVVVAGAVALTLGVFCCFCSCARRPPTPSPPSPGVFTFDEVTLPAGMETGQKVTWVVFAPVASDGSSSKRPQPFRAELTSLRGARMTFVGCNTAEFDTVKKECLDEVRAVVRSAQDSGPVELVVDVPGKLVKWAAKSIQSWVLPKVKFIFNSCPLERSDLFDPLKTQCKGGQPVMFDPHREESMHPEMRYYEEKEVGFTTKATDVTTVEGVTTRREGPTFSCCVSGVSMHLDHRLRYRCDSDFFRGSFPAHMQFEEYGFRLISAYRGERSGRVVLVTKNVFVTPTEASSGAILEYICDGGPIRHNFAEHNNLHFSHFVVVAKSAYQKAPTRSTNAVQIVLLGDNEGPRQPITRWRGPQYYASYFCFVSHLRDCIKTVKIESTLEDLEFFIVGESAVKTAHTVYEMIRRNLPIRHSSLRFLLKEPKEKATSFKRQSSRLGFGSKATDRDQAATIASTIWQQYGTEPSTSVSVYSSYTKSEHAGFFKVGDDHCYGSLVIRYHLDDWSCLRGDGETATEPCWQVSEARPRRVSRRRQVKITITMEGKVAILNSELTGQAAGMTLTQKAHFAYHFIPKSSRKGSGSGTGSSSSSQSPTGTGEASTPRIHRSSVSPTGSVKVPKTRKEAQKGLSFRARFGGSTFEESLTPHSDEPMSPPFDEEQFSPLHSSPRPVGSPFSPGFPGHEGRTYRFSGGGGNGSRPSSEEVQSPEGSYTPSLSSGEPSPGGSPPERPPKWHRTRQLSRGDSEEDTSSPSPSEAHMPLARTLSLKLGIGGLGGERGPLTFYCDRTKLMEVKDSAITIWRSDVQLRVTDVSLLPHTRMRFASSSAEPLHA